MNFKKGFTLIELLVVVAIIGILASVVLASLNSARVKGSVAAIKSNLQNMIDAAEISYDSATPNSYSGACASVAGMISAVSGAGGTASCYSYDGTRWGASARLNSDSTQDWSVDSSGIVTWDTADQSGGAQMTWSAANTACATAGGRLPTIEQLVSLFNDGMILPGFQTSRGYWSGTPVNGGSSYFANNTGAITMGSNANGATYLVRCVR